MRHPPYPAGCVYFSCCLSNCIKFSNLKSCRFTLASKNGCTSDTTNDQSKALSLSITIVIQFSGVSLGPLHPVCISALFRKIKLGKGQAKSLIYQYKS